MAEGRWPVGSKAESVSREMNAVPCEPVKTGDEMMNRFRYLSLALKAIVFMALTVYPHSANAQLPADHNRGQNRPILDGSVESVGGRLQVSLTNTDDARSVSGVARVSLGAGDKQAEVARFEFTLAPKESRLFPLGSRGGPGDHYTLAIYERAGSLIFLKNAPVNRGAISAPIAPPPAPANPAPVATAAKELTIKARLAPERPVQSRGSEIKPPAVVRPILPQVVETKSPAPSRQEVSESEAPAPGKPEVAIARVAPSAKAVRRRQRRAENQSQAVERPGAPQGVESPIFMEAPISDEPGPVVLAFEIAAPSPIINASLSVSAKEFKQRQTVTVEGSANVEFKLPEDFDEPKIAYTLADASGRALARGELGLEDLRQEDSVSVSDVKIDQATYAPGESAHFVVTLEGRSPYGYRLEVTAKDANAETLLNDSRKGIFSKGKSIQEFRVEIPAEAKGIVTIELKAFGNLTRKLFGSVVREIIINDKQSDKTEDRGSKIEDLRIEDRK